MQEQIDVPVQAATVIAFDWRRKKMCLGESIENISAERTDEVYATVNLRKVSDARNKKYDDHNLVACSSDHNLSSCS